MHPFSSAGAMAAWGIMQEFLIAGPEDGTRVCTRRMRFTVRVCPGPAAMLCPFLSAVSAWHSSSLSRLSCLHLSSSFFTCNVNPAPYAYISGTTIREVVMPPLWLS